MPLLWSFAGVDDQNDSPKILRHAWILTVSLYVTPWHQFGEVVDLAESLRQRQDANRRSQLRRLSQSLRTVENLRKSHHLAFQKWSSRSGGQCGVGSPLIARGFRSTISAVWRPLLGPPKHPFFAICWAHVVSVICCACRGSVHRTVMRPYLMLFCPGLYFCFELGLRVYSTNKWRRVTISLRTGGQGHPTLIHTPTLNPTHKHPPKKYLQTNGRTNGRTKPLIELRVRH